MVKRKIVARTQNDGWKPKKKRKPMTEEQRKAAAERLAVARAKKAPSQNTSIHPSVLALPDDHYLSYKNVKGWIKTNKELVSGLRGDVRRDVKGAKAKLHSKEGYVRNMQHYLKHGDWIDNFYGEYEEKKVQWVTIKPSGAM